MKYLKKFNEDNIPGNAPIQKQLHVFDFDDTLGVTKNPNGVMLYKNGKPAHKTEKDVLEWLSKYGISDSDLLPGPDGKKIQFFDNLGGCAAYVDSAKLAALTKSDEFETKDKRYATGDKEDPNWKGLPPENIDQALYIDFTPSGFIDLKTTKPIKNVIMKLGDMEDKGADTMIMTARKGTGEGVNFKGEKVPITNSKDIQDFLDNNGDDSSKTKVIGVIGGDKGEEIKKEIVKKGSWPEEIHFYDDAGQNTNAVEKELGGKVPAEVYIYGPGEFEKGEANPNKPTKTFKHNLPRKVN